MHSDAPFATRMDLTEEQIRNVQVDTSLEDAAFCQEFALLNSCATFEVGGGFDCDFADGFPCCHPLHEMLSAAIERPPVHVHCRLCHNAIATQHLQSHRLND